MVGYFANWVLLFPIAVSLFVMLRVLVASGESRRDAPWVLILRLIVVVCLGFSFLGIGLRMSFISLIWVALFIGLFILLLVKNLRLRRTALLETALAAENSSQRQAIAGYFFEENSGLIKHKAAIWRRALGVGLDWGRGLEAAGIARSSYERVEVRLQSRYGRADHDPAEPTRFLDSTSPQTTSSPRPGYRSAGRERGMIAGRHRTAFTPLHVEEEVERLFGRLAIFAWSALGLPALVAFMVFILPTFQEMFEEFGMDLPWLMNVVSESMKGASFAVLSLLLLLPTGLLLVIGVTTLLVWMWPELASSFPLNRLFRRYYNAMGLIVLTRTALEESNWRDACQATAEILPMASDASMYQRAARRIEHGMAADEALTRARILRHDQASILRLGATTCGPLWGIHQIAMANVEGMLQRYQLLVQTAVFALTMLLAVPVGVLAVALFQSLTVLIMRQP